MTTAWRSLHDVSLTIRTNADEVHRRRWEAGLSRAQLAEQVGCTAQHIYGVERGISQASPGLTKRIAEVLGCQVADLLEQQREPAA